MHIKLLFLLLIFSLGFQLNSTAQEPYTLVWYNVENLFDTHNDSLKQDDEFTPEGPRAWNNYKYKRKLVHIAKTLIALGKWSAPDIVGLCEIENREVLKDLIYKTPLKYHSYGIVHYESPDLRGIDVALLYRKDRVEVLHSAPLPVNFPDTTNRPTRDILEVSLLFPAGDTLYLFLNHWPSMWGGQLTTRPKRMAAASALRKRIDSLRRKSPAARIITMGDFNCTPEDPEINQGLKALDPQPELADSLIYKLSPRFPAEIKGTHKFHNIWSHIDQIHASGLVIRNNAGVQCEKSYRVAAPDFLLTQDANYGGIKPFRTFYGFTYQGGFSDHLPLVLVITTNGEEP
jgi:endonuclease/exonuclease/phosphatase family metal-dependent hydrolase